MANSIITGDGSVSIPTPSTGNANLGEWLSDHHDDITAGHARPLGDTLSGSWTTAGGEAALNPPTTRDPDESDADFIQRHIERLLSAMTPPNPPPEW